MLSICPRDRASFDYVSTVGIFALGFCCGVVATKLASSERRLNDMKSYFLRLVYGIALAFENLCSISSAGWPWIFSTPELQDSPRSELNPDETGTLASEDSNAVATRRRRISESGQRRKSSFGNIAPPLLKSLGAHIP